MLRYEEEPQQPNEFHNNDHGSSPPGNYSHPDDQIDISKTQSLTDRQYMICSASIWGFVIKLRQWGTSRPRSYGI